MKTKQILKTSLLALIAGNFLLSSCSLIGLGIGSMVDSKTPKTSPVSKFQVDTIAIGSNLEISTFDGEIFYGKLGGIVPVYSEEFNVSYGEINQTLADQIKLPGINDTLHFSLSSEKNVNKVGVFKGFEFGKLWFKPFFSNDISDVDIFLLHSFTCKNVMIDSTQIVDLIAKQKFPNFIHLEMDVKEKKIEYIAINRISNIQVMNKRNGKYVGLGVGLAIDVIISIAAISSMQNTSFSMSF